MHKRKVFYAFEQHLDQKLETVITGLRRVGKIPPLKDFHEFIWGGALVKS